MFEEAKTFPKPTKWESSSFAYYATVNQIEKKTFKQLMTATAFQVEKESIDERMTKEKHSRTLWKVIWVIWFKPAESIRPRTVTISLQPKI